MREDQNDTLLRICSIFQYIIAWVLVFISCIPILYIIIGSIMVFAGFAPGQNEPKAGDALPFFIAGGFFLTLGGIMCMVGLIIAFCVFICARRLKTKRKYNYCLTITAIECLFFPVGTLIGVLTIILLSNHDVKESFS